VNPEQPSPEPPRRLGLLRCRHPLPGGELLHTSGDARAAEATFRKALGIAREQGARIFELRAATGLGRLLVEQGRGAEARPALAAAYEAFREGFETRDLIEARELLDGLSLHPEGGPSGRYTSGLLSE
jgi:hypothetical protein